MGEFQPISENRHRLSRRKLLFAAGAAVSLGLTSCANPDQPPGPSLQEISDEEKIFPNITIAELQEPERLQELVGESIRTKGYLTIRDQDLIFYNQYGETYEGDKHIVEEVEELTYELHDSPTRDGSMIFAVDENKYPLIYGHAGLDQSKTIIENPNQEWILTGEVKYETVETGDEEADKIETYFLQVKGIYSSDS